MSSTGPNPSSYKDNGINPIGSSSMLFIFREELRAAPVNMEKSRWKIYREVKVYTVLFTLK